MPIFEYKGVGPDGKQMKGTVDAESSRSARQKLKNRGVYTTELRERSADARTSGRSAVTGGITVKLKNLTLMIRQLATMVKARIPLDEALAAVVDQTDDPRLKSIMSQVKTSVNEGKSLADSCALFPKVFTPIYVSMIRVGEASGKLDLVLVRLATFSENQMEMRNKILGALAYPAFMMVAGTGIVIFLFAFAVPKITEVFAGSNMALPALTVVMIKISDFMAAHWLLLAIALVGSYSFFMWYISTPPGRAWWDAFSLRIPGVGKLKRMVAVSRFARTLSTMLGSGVQLLDAIDVVKEVVENTVIKNALERSKTSISEGQSIAGPLRASGEFPPMLTHMIAVGEKTGELEEMLNVVSDAYDSQVDNAIKSMTRLLEPLMIAVMGGIIGLVALSIFMPLLELNNLAGGTG
ncbi:MAG: type II secretion system protein GspF [Proteobacteria bacterium]|nr:type II secretion system protein GspF [Pseudomonadota bacterium]NDC23419.1 type II secretion system protein GspF [Pseudomonadota bacterium]NDD03588.1 type II secretion system protein GspF [Pseudomonadota bacterium]NDG25684.1 type II secretion system protein GspF [Pseudomonadota bacterium]